MTDTTPQSTPPGWYPDHANPALQRWWDGTKWTEHIQQPYAAGGVQLKAPEGTNWNTPWIWLIVLLPILAYGGLLFLNVSSFVTTDPKAIVAAMNGVLVWTIVYTALALVLSAAIVFFAYLDWRELTARGVPEPFHWAFAFLGSVYPIGRAIVTNRRTGGGLAVLWATIAVFVAGIVFAVGWSIVFTLQLTQQLVELGVR